MSTFDLLIQNLTSPMILAFALGLVARLVRSDLKFPEALSSTLAIFLLLAIGLKGGAALNGVQPQAIILAAVATLVLGSTIPLWSYAIARRLGGFTRSDAACLAAHYGSTSAVTFLACLTFLAQVGSTPEGFMPALLAILEIPAIVVALVLLRLRQGGGEGFGEAIRHVAAGKSIVLLLGGMAIGWAAGHDGVQEVKAFFVDPFKGVLCLFLLDLGMLAADRFTDLRQHWRFLVPFGILLPLANGVLGVLAGWICGLSPGGSTVLGTLCASASYIAAPAACRIAIPQANHALALGASLGITFPFNLVLGIPIFHTLATSLGH